MILITTHDPDGRLIAQKMVGEITASTILPYGLYVDGNHDPEVKMVSPAGLVVNRPPNPTLVTGTTLYNIPMPSTLRIGDGREVNYYEVTDSTMELDFLYPGQYLVTVQSFPQVNAFFNFTIP